MEQNLSSLSNKLFGLSCVFHGITFTTDEGSLYDGSEYDKPKKPNS